jgi:hypothetical protein
MAVGGIIDFISGAAAVASPGYEATGMFSGNGIGVVDEGVSAGAGVTSALATGGNSGIGGNSAGAVLSVCGRLVTGVSAERFVGGIAGGAEFNS